MQRFTLVLTAAVVAANAAGAPQNDIEVIEVVATTPAGTEQNPDSLPANVHRALSEDIRSRRALGLADYMAAQFTGVNINDAQNNPLQPDVQYRGFVGSPLLGLPQGLSVYQDGIRINEPFGDTINWALLDDNAVDSVTLMPGSNPLFGLNTLGGAVSIRTKTGVTHPGTSAEIYTGSFARTGIEVETGGMRQDFSYFLAASHLQEDGFRDFSPTRAARFFTSLGLQGEGTSLDLKVTLADTNLIGNGAVPVQLLRADRAAVFTRPDQTENDLAMLALQFAHNLTADTSVNATAYWRDSRIDTYNGDDSDFEDCEDITGFICEEEDGDQVLLLDAADNPVPAQATLLGATVNRSSTDQRVKGFVTELAFAQPGRTHTIGMSYDASNISFAASTELGMLDATRRAVPGGFYVTDAFTDLGTEVTNAGIYFASFVDLTERTGLNVSGRYNRTDIALRDRLGTSLNGDHAFRRFNPAVGVTIALGGSSMLYASYAESNRAPSPVELTCADPDDPCRLPNAFLADPPLDDVVAKTAEVGIRGTVRSNGEWHTDGHSEVRWRASLYRTRNVDDILFISAGPLTNQGYFDNVGRTRRQGIELSVHVRSGSLTWFFDYAYLDATFLEEIDLPSPNHPLAVGGEVSVRRGNMLPLLPSHVAKAGITFAPTPAVRLSANVFRASAIHLRGDESNLLDAVDGYIDVDLRFEYDLTPHVNLFLAVDNLLDAEYETFGVLGEADEVLGDDFDDPRFLSPAAPRGAWIGIRLQR